MGNDEGPIGLTAILAAPAFVAIGIGLLQWLSIELLTILTAWVLLSFPLGVLVGHCVLKEEDERDPGQYPIKRA